MSASSAASAARGELIVVGASMEPMEVPPVAADRRRSTVDRRPRVGHRRRTPRTRCAFSALSGRAPMIETMPLEEAAEAYERMMAGDARFRMVLTVD